MEDNDRFIQIPNKYTLGGKKHWQKSVNQQKNYTQVSSLSKKETTQACESMGKIYPSLACMAKKQAKSS